MASMDPLFYGPTSKEKDKDEGGISFKCDECGKNFDARKKANRCKLKHANHLKEVKRREKEREMDGRLIDVVFRFFTDYSIIIQCLFLFEISN